jgi:hypothetical protein
VLLDRVEIGCGPVEGPGVASQAQDDDDQDPDRPELAARTGDKPDRRADDEERRRTPGLLNHPARQVGAPLAVGEGERLLGQREVMANRVELGGRPGGVDGLSALLELVGAQASGDRVLLEVGDKTFPLLV